MDLELTSALVLLGTAVPIALGLGWYAWRNRSLPGAYPFLLMLPLAALWAMALALELLTRTLTGKLFWADVQYVGICFFPILALALALDYAGHRKLLTWPKVVAACVLPVTTLGLLVTDGSHHLVRASVWLDTNGSMPVLGRTWGPWFWVHSAYSSVVMIAALGVLIGVARSAALLRRRQLIAIMAGPVVPLFCAFLYLLDPGAMLAYDLTSVGLLIAAIAVTWGLFRPRLFSVVPVARHALVENMTDGVLVLDQWGRVIDLNKSAQALIDRPAAQIISRPLAESWPPWAPMDAPPTDTSSQTELHLTEGGAGRHYEVSWSPLAKRGHVVGQLVVLRNVTERVLMEDNLRQQALTDGLTGLPNRALFMARLDDAIHQAKRRSTMIFAVMVLDLDRFKLINDSIGHLAGDVLLQSVAAKLHRCVREVDTVGRMGGDEFMILLRDVAGIREVLPILERIQEDLATPVYFRQQEMTAACSVGVVLWDPSYEDAEGLLRAADTAMYQAKEDGRGCYRVFDEDMHRTVSRTLKAETDLRVALRQRDFSMSYQPIAELRTGEIRSLEALMRWQHPQRGTVFPDEFISIAENGGLIVQLGELALDEVCSQMSRWQSSKSLAADLPVSLNLSPRQLVEPDFLSTVVSRLAAWRVPPDRLAVEITETALIRDPIRSKEVMQELRGLGMRICLDDFGRGWSSLQHLTTFPVEELKIDRSFISRITQDRTNREIVRLLTALAHTLGLKVTAEGVEHSEQWRLLQELGCDNAQGYFIGRPMDPDELLEYLEGVDEAACFLGAAPETSADRPRQQEAAGGPASPVPPLARRGHVSPAGE